MLFDDSIADAQAEARAFADWLGCIKRVEGTIDISEAWTTVLDFKNRALSPGKGSQGDALVGARTLDGIDGIVYQIEENLLKLVFIHGYRRQVGRYVNRDLQIAGTHMVFTQRQHVLDQGFEPDRASLDWTMERKTQQVLDDSFHAPALVQNPESAVLKGSAGHFRTHQLAITQHCGKWIVELVRHAGNQLAQCCQLFRTHQLVLQRLHLQGHSKVRGQRLDA